MRLLRSAGGPLVLRSVAAAACDTDAQVKDAAQRVLCEWLTPDALPPVAGLVKTPPSETIKILALRGFVRLFAPAGRLRCEKARLAEGGDGPGRWR